MWTVPAARLLEHKMNEIATSKRKQIQVDVFADIICPWCYIGKTRLEEAFAQRPEIEPIYRWRTFLLNPKMPVGGMDRTAYLTAKFGQAAAAVYGRIAMAGLEADISFKFSDIQRTPDTRPIHKILIASGEAAPLLSDAFYEAYFLNGEDISDSAIQKRLIEETSLVHKSAADALLPEKLSEAETQLDSDLRQVQRLGIDGVPLMIFNSNFSLAGAYPSDILLNAIDAALQHD